MEAQKSLGLRVLRGLRVFAICWPAIERDRRIALQDRSTRFFGTDFTFEDLEERDVDQFDYTLGGEETLDGAACWRVESTPKNGKSSQYTRSILWVRKDTYAFARL